MTQSIPLTPSDLLNEENYIKAIERLERESGKKVKEVVLKNMVLIVKEWKE